MNLTPFFTASAKTCEELTIHMLQECFLTIDCLEAEKRDLQRKVEYQEELLNIIGRKLELRKGSTYTCIGMKNSIFDDDDNFQKLVDEFGMKLEEEET